MVSLLLWLQDRFYLSFIHLCWVQAHGWSSVGFEAFVLCAAFTVKFQFPAKHCRCLFWSAQSWSGRHPRSQKRASSQTHQSCPAHSPWQTNWRNAKMSTQWSTFAMKRCLYHRPTTHSLRVSLLNCYQTFNPHLLSDYQFEGTKSSKHVHFSLKNWIRRWMMPQRIPEEQKCLYPTHVNWIYPKSQVWSHLLCSCIRSFFFWADV